MPNNTQRGVSFLLLVAFGGVVAFLLLSYFANFSHGLLLSKLFPKPPTFAASSAYFCIGAGYVDNVPRQIIRASNDRLYLFASIVQTPGILKAYWNPAGGFPSSGSEFSGTAQVSNGINSTSLDRNMTGATCLRSFDQINSGTTYFTSYEIREGDLTIHKDADLADTIMIAEHGRQ